MTVMAHAVALIPQLEEILSDPCFDPYGVISGWTKQDAMDLDVSNYPETGAKIPRPATKFTFQSSS